MFASGRGDSERWRRLGARGAPALADAGTAFGPQRRALGIVAL